MKAERLKQIEEVYHRILEISPDKRESFFNEYCGDDPDLRLEVESLLSFNKTSDNLLNASPESLAVEMFSDEKPDSYIGKKIGHYKIKNLLGKGGMGEVYLGQDEKLHRNVALKILPGDFANDKERMSRFLQEARAASALNHANILTIYEISEIDGINFIATEYIAGITLTEYLEKMDMNFKKVLDIAVQITSALVAAHEAGVIHRDIKPDNVMVRDDGTVKVLDFGIAKPALKNSNVDLDTEAATREKIMTRPGMILGTPQYMSPEQARGRKIDSRTDIFSVGIVLYEMIAGKPPFTGENEFDTIGSILREEPKPLKEYFPEIPAELEHLVSKALRKDPEQRYQSIKELHIDLNDIRVDLDTDLRLVRQTNQDKLAQTAKTNNSIISDPRFSLVQIVVLLLVISATLGTIWWMTASSSTNVNQSRIQLKTEEIFNWASKPGEFYSTGSFSPDSKMVAFVSTRSDNKSIWVKRTTSGEAVEITKDNLNYRNPIWSPNGEELAFYSNKSGKSGFWRIPILGGSPKLITAIDDPSNHLLFWSATNRIYFESNQNLYAIDVDAQKITQVTDLTLENISSISMSLSRDEKNVAFTTLEGNIWNLWISDLTGEKAKKVFTAKTEIRNTAWHPNNENLFFSHLVDETLQIFETDPAGNSPRQLTFFEQDAFVNDISSDGSKILYGWAKEESDIWRVDLENSNETNVASEIDSELWADVSPDGKTLVYQAIKNLSQGNKIYDGKILSKTLEVNEDPTELVSKGLLPKWSPNGEYIAYINDGGDDYQLKTIRPDGSGIKVLADNIVSPSYSVLPYNRNETTYFDWSHDSEKIAYISRRNGQANIWLIKSDGSENIQLTENTDSNSELNCPIWSTDGKQIAYTTLTPDSDSKLLYGVKIIDVETKKIKKVKTENSLLRLIGWSADNSGLLLVNYKHSTTLRSEISLLNVQIESGETKEISKFENTYQYNIFLSPDKTKIAYVANLKGRDNIWIIPATGGSAKQITRNNDSRLFFSSLTWSPDNNSIFFGKQMRYSLLSMLKDYK